MNAPFNTTRSSQCSAPWAATRSPRSCRSSPLACSSAALTARRHVVSVRPEYVSDVGHAQVITPEANGF